MSRKQSFLSCFYASLEFLTKEMELQHRVYQRDQSPEAFFVCQVKKIMDIFGVFGHYKWKYKIGADNVLRKGAKQK